MVDSKQQWKAWLYLAPAIALLLVFTVWPIINTVVMAFMEGYSGLAKAGGEAMRAYVQSRENKPVYFYEADEVVYDAMKQNLKGAMAMFLGRD